MSKILYVCVVLLLMGLVALFSWIYIFFRAVKIENSVMKKCHEENMSDAHQVYIKILEAIGGSVYTTHICS